MKKEEKALNWCLRCAPGDWVIKRDESELLPVCISASVLSHTSLIALQKQDIPLEKKEEKAPVAPAGGKSADTPVKKRK